MRLDPGRKAESESELLLRRKVDAEIAQAQKIQITNPYAAVGTWVREKELVDLAPWVPLFTPWSGDVVSERVGNYLPVQTPDGISG